MHQDCFGAIRLARGSDIIQSETANSSDRGLSFTQGIYYWPKVRKGTLYPKEGTIFYPAAGYRNYTSGALTEVGYSGYNRSASAIGTERASNLAFNSGVVYPSYNTSRGHGFAARCVSE